MKMHPTQRFSSHELQVRANLIAAGRACSIAEIAEYSGLTRAQVIRAARGLIRKGFGLAEARMLAREGLSER